MLSASQITERLRTRTLSGPSARVCFLIAVVACAAGTILMLTTPGLLATLRHNFGGFLLFLGVVLFLQIFAVELPGRGSVGVSAVGVLAAAFTLGTGAAVVIALSAAIAQAVRRRGILHRTLFDASNFVLSTATASAAYATVSRTGASPAIQVTAGVLGGVGYAAVNNGLLLLAMGWSEKRPLLAVWRQRFHWARFHFLAFGILGLACSLAYSRIGGVGLLAFALPPALLLYSIRQYLEHTQAAFEQVHNTHLATISALSRSMEAKDGYTGGHTERVAPLAAAIADRLGYRDEERQAVQTGALLHDIGKIGIPEHILHKPGPLNDDEWKIMKQHPIVSDRILAEVDLHPIVREIARSSHERIDGRGYPDGLAGDAIPLPARIVLVADAFDALTSDRPYRRGRAVTAALAELHAHSGTQFCPKVLAALDEVAAEQPHLVQVTTPHELSAAQNPHPRHANLDSQILVT